MELSGKTKVFGIIGDPVAHSLSPLFQSRFLEELEVDGVYVPFHVADGGVEVVLAGLWAAGVQGLNVTVPHKERVLPLVQADADAQLIGAVNTLYRGDDGWQATNTDWQGFAAVLQGIEARLAEGGVLLFGAGGTARAVLHALAVSGAQRVSICNRNGGRAAALAAHAAQYYPQLRVGTVAWDADAVAGSSESCEVVINTTSIGLQGEPFPFALHGAGVAVDAVYRPDGNTAFCESARRCGRTAIDGLPMLVAQGAASFTCWHQGMRPDKRETLAWLEARLGRGAIAMPGWKEAA